MARKNRGAMLLDVLNAPWAIVPSKLLEIRKIFVARAFQEPLEIDAIEAVLGRPMANEHEAYEVRDGVAVIHADGVIAKRMNLFSQISGGTSSQLLEQDIAQALEDPNVHSIVMSMDSPGGTVDGMFELSNAIHAARGKKPMVAFADGMMGSAAYIIGSAMDRVYAGGESAQIGSIGVVATHTDFSKADEMRGEKITEISAGKYKRIASEHEALSADGRANIQGKLDYLYSLAVDHTARNRGVNFKTVLDHMADGQIFIGEQAVKAGLADGITTLPALISQLNREHASPATSHREAAQMNEKIEEKKPAVDTAAIEKAAFDKGKSEGFSDGAKAERDRIVAVEAQSCPGHEELIAKLKADGKTTGPEAAVQVLAAIKAKAGQRLTDLKADSPTPAAHAEAPVDEPLDADSKVNPQELAAEAQKYQREQAKEGVTVSVAQAVRHIEKKLKKSA